MKSNEDKNAGSCPEKTGKKSRLTGTLCPPPLASVVLPFSSLSSAEVGGFLKGSSLSWVDGWFYAGLSRELL
jgi:hypothetical protein